MGDDRESLARELWDAYARWRLEVRNIASPRYQFTRAEYLAPFRELADRLLAERN